MACLRPPEPGLFYVVVGLLTTSLSDLNSFSKCTAPHRLAVMGNFYIYAFRQAPMRTAWNCWAIPVVVKATALPSCERSILSVVCTDELTATTN